MTRRSARLIHGRVLLAILSPLKHETGLRNIGEWVEATFGVQSWQRSSHAGRTPCGIGQAG